MAVNQTKRFRLEQKSVIKSLLAEKWKPCEIYQKICDEYWEACFSQKNLYKLAKDKFGITSLSRKDSTFRKMHWISGKENVLGAVVSKKIILTVFWDTKDPSLLISGKKVIQ